MMMLGFRRIFGIFTFAIFAVPVENSEEFPILNGMTDKNKTPMYNFRNICSYPTSATQLSNPETFLGNFVFPEKLDISYLLFTRQNPQEEYEIQSENSSLSKSTFNPCIGSIFLIHGYSAHLIKSDVLFDIKDELLKEGDYNVIVVNWTKYDDYNYYVQEIPYRAPSVAYEISRFITYLIKNAPIIPESIYIIGHSLGAQVASYVGKLIPNIGRITGLDAAGPGYNYFPKQLRLTYTDAIFVDAIHTGGSLFPSRGNGFLNPYGDIDFFPNGGEQQPKCKMNASFQYTNKEVAYVDSREARRSCNHQLAPFYYLNSINNCTFTAVLCANYKSFKNGDCSGNTVNRMGFHARPMKDLPEESRFYLQTTTETPYCIQ